MNYLNDLPQEHPDRNRPLVGAFYRWQHFKKTWKEIMPAFRIAQCTFNDLAPCWTDNDRFTFENPYSS